MGFFGLFKKKDDFDSMLKDPLTDPLGGMPNDINGMPAMPGNNFPRNDLPSFESPGTTLRDETGIESFSQMNMNNNQLNQGFGTTATPVQTNNSQYANSPPMFRQPQMMSQKGKNEPEVFEEMPIQQKQNQQKTEAFSLDKRDVELLNSKLDTIKTQLENLNHRLDNIERGTYDTQNQRRRYAW